MDWMADQQDELDGGGGYRLSDKSQVIEMELRGLKIKGYTESTLRVLLRTAQGATRKRFHCEQYWFYVAPLMLRERNRSPFLSGKGWDF